MKKIVEKLVLVCVLGSICFACVSSKGIDYKTKKEQEYKDQFANPYVAAKYGYIDDVIEPRNSRFRIIRALQTLATKKETLPPKKHSNIPL